MTLNPIVVDLEMSGLNAEKCGIWQIGAIDLNTMEEFLDEARIDDKDVVEEGALKVIGKTEEELRDEEKQSQKELIQKFMEWVADRKMRTLLCHHPQADMGFLNNKANKYGIRKTFQYSAFDTHSLAQMRYLELNNEFLIRKSKDFKGFESDMSLANVLEFCGIPDDRIKVVEGEIIEKGKPHNALKDAKLTGECFSRLLYGENLFPEFSKFPVPGVLKK